MRIIGQGMYFKQQRPKNWGQLPIGATLGDELGGVGYIGADGTTQMIVPTDYVMPKPDYTKMNAMPLPTDSQGNIVDLKGNLILDVSGNPVKSKEFNNNSSNVPTSVSSAPENKDAPQPKRISDDILGMPKNVAIGLGVVLLAVGGYFLYKKVINKSI